MPYEIPQNLKYSEKIAFGLTFWQLFWVALFGGLAALVVFKTPFDLAVKILLAAPLLGLGVSFAFFNLASILQDYKNFFFSKRQVGYFDKQMSDFVSVEKIEHNAIYLKNGSLRTVLEVRPINFSILSQEEQKAIISAYKDFLNSLDFPVQIVMRTTSLSLDNYLFDLRQNVLKLNNPKLEEQFESFKEFVQDFIKENSVKNRLFYIVIPYSPYSRTQPLKDLYSSLNGLFSGKKQKTSLQLNRELALNQLHIRAELCKEKLKRCGLFVERLNSKQLLSLTASFFENFIQNENDYLFPITLLKEFEGEKKCSPE